MILDSFLDVLSVQVQLHSLIALGSRLLAVVCPDSQLPFLTVATEGLGCKDSF